MTTVRLSAGIAEGQVTLTTYLGERTEHVALMEPATARIVAAQLVRMADALEPLRNGSRDAREGYSGGAGERDR